jgi:preprotein translocase subunit SecG
MTTLILIAHVIACVLLILIVLLQTGKGADMGASFGGASSQALFGGAGPATFLSKITTGVAIIFMLTSLTLAYTSSHRSQTSIMPDIEIPVEKPAATDSN